MRLLLLAALLGCNHETLSVPTDGAADLTGATDLTNASKRDCGDGTNNVPCPGRMPEPYCPHRGWCDTSGSTPVCRCGDQVVDTAPPDCACPRGEDPAYPGCSPTGFAGCA